MERKKFIQTALLGTATFFVPNAALTMSNSGANKTANAPANPEQALFTSPEFDDYKLNTQGTAFYKTQVGFYTDAESKEYVLLPREFYISHADDGYGTPALYFDGTDYYVFVTALFRDSRMNGWVYKYNKTQGFTAEQLYKHENMGWYAFWGKRENGLPVLYHYDQKDYALRKSFIENDAWATGKLYTAPPQEAILLYNTLANQFTYDYTIHKDGFYDFLKLKNDWEQSILNQQKDLDEPVALLHLKETRRLTNPVNIISNKQNTEGENLPLNNYQAEGYTGAFVPIWCVGDDASYAITKPTKWYKEIQGSKLEIPNMPPYKTQDELGDCRAFSLATLIQKYICDKDVEKTWGCLPEYAISSFGMLIYTNRNPDVSKSFEPNQTRSRNMYEIITDISDSGSRFILESCKPFNKIVSRLNSKESDGRYRFQTVFPDLKQLYDTRKDSALENITDCEDCIVKIFDSVGLEVSMQSFKKALSKDTYEKFLYVLFFDDCKMRTFALGFKPNAYPNDVTNATPFDLKRHVIEGLKLGNPVLYAAICAFPQSEDNCMSPHSVVVSGYKKVVSSKNEVKEVFKVYNSWGHDWQKQHNDGWVDADTFTENTTREKVNGKNRIPSGCVIWLV